LNNLNQGLDDSLFIGLCNRLIGAMGRKKIKNEIDNGHVANASQYSIQTEFGR
jgi:hypothetical protein